MKEPIRLYIVAPIIGGVLWVVYNSYILTHPTLIFPLFKKTLWDYRYLLLIDFLFAYFIVCVSNFFSSIFFNKDESKKIKLITNTSNEDRGKSFKKWTLLRPRYIVLLSSFALMVISSVFVKEYLWTTLLLGVGIILMLLVVYFILFEEILELKDELESIKRS